ncbi:MAG: glycosyltransferase [Acetobacteraceae bacterium]|nr:glycosyltransferase [Acetobacteraceae bacterium]
MLNPLRLLTFSTLFPNSGDPNHGVFVANRLAHLVASGEVVSSVVAPVPYLPPVAGRLERWRRYLSVDSMEQRRGITIHHPRYPVIPGVGMSIAPILLYAASVLCVRRLIAAGLAFDGIDAHYLYPDGVAAIWLGQRFNLPVVITARGSDVTQLSTHAVPRGLIRLAMRKADALIAVSAALKQAMIGLGANAAKITVLRNGVDTRLFRPRDRAAPRRALGLSRPTLVSVGLLIERKGHHRTIEAMRLLPGFDLLIAGEGPERGRLERLIARLGLGDRVRLLGARPHDCLPELYEAADAMILASSREGWANVLLESMACGTPVIASNIWGNPEVVQSPECGLIFEPNTPEAIAEAVQRLFRNLPSRSATRAYAERFSWDETTAGQLAIFRRVTAGGHRQDACLGATCCASLGGAHA